MRNGGGESACEAGQSLQPLARHAGAAHVHAAVSYPPLLVGMRFPFLASQVGWLARIGSCAVGGRVLVDLTIP
jgi:hypothetical protein